MQTHKPLVVRGVAIGAGLPKVCVPVMGETEEEVLRSAQQAAQVHPDLVEWRIDHLASPDFPTVYPILLALRERYFAATPLLVTLRTKDEGGELEIESDDYVNLLSYVIATGLPDLIDVQLFIGESRVRRLAAQAHTMGMLVVGSNHDFQRTPPEEELVSRLEAMIRLGCDIPKIAVMPQNSRDVLTLLSATEAMRAAHPDVPVITMSMGHTGLISRLCGELFGSAVTFGSAGQASAPGQVPVAELRSVLKLLH